MAQCTPMFARVAMIVLFALCLTGSRPARAESTAEALDAIAGRIPREIGALRATGADTRYDTKSIYDYLDGGAELYLAYRMRGCLAREYAAGDLIVTLDLFEMGSAADAFGVFTQDQDGEIVEIGQNALIRSGWLSFRKGRFFVSVTATKTGDLARASSLAVGRAAAAAIRDTGLPPDLLGRLPQAGLVPRSTRFLRSPVLLAPHVDLGPDNPLRLGRDVEVVLARYDRTGQKAWLLLARYSTAAEARAAAHSASSRLRTMRRHGKVAVLGRDLALALQEQGSALVGPLVEEAGR